MAEADTDTGALPKVVFADKTEKPVELKSAVVEKVPKQKKKAGRPKKQQETAASIVADAILEMEGAVHINGKEKEKMSEEAEFVLTQPEPVAPVKIKTEKQVEEKIPKLIDLATIEALELANNRAEVLEKELDHVRAEYEVALTHMNHTLRQQREQGALAVHTSLIVGGVVGGVAAAGALQLIKLFL